MYILHHKVYINYTLQTFFIKPFLLFWKNLVSTKYSLYTNNFTKSTLFFLVHNLTKNVKPKRTLHSLYLQPLVLLNFAFHKHIYNTFIIYILYSLTNHYCSNYTNFSLWYSFILLPKNFYMLNFCKNYYFKLNQFKTNFIFFIW
jgi:hypothetical protein